MKPILLLYWRVCRLSAGPEEVPWSRELLALTLVAWFQIPVFLLLCWQLLAQGHVFHRALNVGPILGTMVAVMILLLTYAAVAMAFPESIGGSA